VIVIDVYIFSVKKNAKPSLASDLKDVEKGRGHIYIRTQM